MLVTAIGLAEFYNLLQIALVEEPWIAAATANTILALAVLVYLKFKLPSPQVPKYIGVQLGRFSPLGYLPALLVISFAVTASLVSRHFGTPRSAGISFSQLAWITWIPVVEELVFRVGIGNFFRNRWPFVLATYLAVLTFSLAHSLPTIDRILSLEISAPLGPLVLGIFCELIYVVSGKISHAIALHSACNATVVIFSILDARWLDWLGLLYL